MSTDFRALCAELVAALEIQLDELRFNNRLCVRARAALAQPEPPNLKEQALARCNDYIDPDGIIRRALEALPND